MELQLSPLPLFLTLRATNSMVGPSGMSDKMVIGLSEANNICLKSLLIHSLGSEGQHIFPTLGPAESKSDCVALLV